MSAAFLIVDLLDHVLPQTQCTRCGYADCRGYAEAIAVGAAGINQCPPGGHEGVLRLAALTGREPQPLAAAHGSEGPRRLALIDEAWCIGCTLCLQACPVDCIVGGPRAMHTVIADFCTGCELCIPACPVDCIALVEVPGGHTGWAAWSAEQALQARQRYAHRVDRQSCEAREEIDRLAAGGLGAAAPTDAPAAQAPGKPLPPRQPTAPLEPTEAQANDVAPPQPQEAAVPGPSLPSTQPLAGTSARLAIIEAALARAREARARR